MFGKYLVTTFTDQIVVRTNDIKEAYDKITETDTGIYWIWLMKEDEIGDEGIIWGILVTNIWGNVYKLEETIEVEDLHKLLDPWETNKGGE